jgi:hypothetical protein
VVGFFLLSVLPKSSYHYTDAKIILRAKSAILCSRRRIMDTSNTILIVLVAVAFLAIGAFLALAFTRFQRSKRLRERFGPEYDRTVKRIGDKRQAEDDLETRLAHVQSLNIRSLTAEEVNRFALEWQATQAEFVDQPLAAVQKANRLIREVMSARGYPVEDFEQRAADISVDYPELVINYRELREIATRGKNEKISTEDMDGNYSKLWSNRRRK